MNGTLNKLGTMLLLVIAIVLCLPLTTLAQYSETFSTPNKGYLLNCVNDLTAMNWTLSSWDPTGTCQTNPPDPTTDLRDPSDYFQTTAAGVMESVDLDQEVCWDSPLMNISTAGTVSFSVDLSWVGFDVDVMAGGCLGDYIRVFYSLNGGAYTMVPNMVGGNSCATVAYLFDGPFGPFSSSATVTQGGISGTSLKIRVCVFTNANAEMVTIDNVIVPQAGVSVGCAAPLLSTVVTQVGCSNPNSGAINLSVSAGTPGYTYDWSNDGPENPDNDPQDLSGLSVGTYTVTVTDAASCSATTSVNVTNAPALVLSSQVLGTNCVGSTDGEIDLIVSGGVPGYTYDWSNDGPENPDNDPQDLIGVGTGTYIVTVTDASGCSSTKSSSVGTLSATAYLEQFNIPNKGHLADFVDDFSAVNWSMSSWAPQPPAAFGRDNEDFFRTSGGVLVGEDFDQEICWTSPLIGMNTATQFSVDLAWVGFDDQADEYINVKYSINSGSFITLPNIAGGGVGTIQYNSGLDQNGSATVTKTGLSGNTIQIQVCAQFNSNNESMTIDNVSVPGSSTYCPAPVIVLTPTNVTCTNGNNGNIQVTANSGMPGYNVSWSGPSSGNPAGTEIATEGGSYTITNLAAGNYTVTLTDANGLSADDPATLTALNPLENAAFYYDKTGYCQGGSDPTPIIDGNTGGTFSAPAQVSINPSTGQIDVSASTAGGPYSITYSTVGPCPEMQTFNLAIAGCTPGASMTDILTIDNPPLGTAGIGDRIQLKTTVDNMQAADYEGVQLLLVNNPAVTMVVGSFKSTPVAVDDPYLATMNMQLNVLVGNGVLLNDFDDNIAGLSVTNFDAMSAQGGTVTVNLDGSFTYNPMNGYMGNDTFTYTVTDSDMQTNTATVKIRVQ
ncbi:MAG: cadherin-like domain-containing protein [Saprospiraceae bacterium]|nr:cadherin-like domain-containing protein [Saprospiraceae bacterium]